MNIIKPENWNDNLFRRIEKDWMLITAGSNENVNTMTASFGGFGILFFKPVAHIYVRPGRHTYSYLESSDTFSLSFFNDESYRSKLQYCGRVSGRDEDKVKACGFTIAEMDGTPYIEQASITVICKKIYSNDISNGTFYDSSIEKKCYPEGDTHRMYIGEIVAILQQS